jgi:hypothetical protein
VRGVPLLRAEKTWREVADRGLEIVICIGHIVGVVMLVSRITLSDGLVIAAFDGLPSSASRLP